MPTTAGSNFLRGLEDDHLYLPPIKEHSFEKIRRHNHYARMFATSMRDRWPQLAYVGLYSGAGRARVEGTGEIIETTALSVFRLPHPFTKYIFVDRDRECIDALEKRIAVLPAAYDVTILPGDVDDLVDDIAGALPRFSRSKGLLSFCFVDPFAANVKFRTLRALGAGCAPRRVEKGSGVIFRLLEPTRSRDRLTGGLRRARTYQG